MSKSKSQTMGTTLQELRRRALEQAATHLMLDADVQTLPSLLDRAVAYASFLDAGALEMFETRAAMLDIARGLADEEGDVVARARRLLRYVEEGR